MRVRQLQLENFRAFRKAEMRLPGTGLVLVAGPNNVGKTALLSALDALAGDHGDLASLRYGGSEEPARLSATFELDQAERAAILENAAGGQWLLDAGVLSSLQVLFEQWQDQSLVLREVLGNWPDAGLQPVARMRREPGQAGHPYGYEVIRAFQKGNGQEDHQGGVLAPLDQAHRLLEVTGTFSEGQAGLDGYLSGQSNLAPIMAPLAAWRSRFYHFRALRAGTQRSQGTSSPEKLDPAGSSLAGVLHYLLTDHTELFEQVGALIAQVVPDIGKLRVLTGGNQMRVVFGSGAHALNLKDLGTGVEQLLMTIVVGLTEEPPFTLLIEEPETNLNPAAQRALLGLLQGWASDRLIVAATHSPVMLDWSPAGDRLWLVSREQGASNVEQVSADPLPLLDALGVRLSDVLSADRVLVVEGTSDEDVLQVWFPHVLRNPRVAVLHGRGGQNARHADQLAEWLAGTDRVGLRQVLYLRDRDELAPEVLERLTQSRSIHVLRRREIENYLLDPDAIAAVIRPLVPNGATAPDAAATAEALNSAADKLRRKIVTNRTAQRVTPPRQLMDTTLRKRLAEDGVDLSEFANAVTERLMTPAELTAQITTAWEEAEADVGKHTGDALLEIAPGEEILDTLFVQYTGRHYKKRVHGPKIAAVMSPPEELVELFRIFMAE
jgi:energy-coupling factor transporter ATP-binding protein EcfA2